MLLIIGLVIGIPLAMCLLVGGVGMLFALGTKQMPLQPGDEAALVTAEDLLASIGSEAVPDPAKVKQGRERLLDGSVEISYEYESQDPPLYVSTIISLERNESDARATYIGQSVGGAAGMALAGQGLKLEPRDDLMKWGDQSKSQLMVLEGNPVGHFFITRKGKRVFVTVFSGVYFDEPELLSSFLTPHLEAMEQL